MTDQANRTVRLDSVDEDGRVTTRELLTESGSATVRARRGSELTDLPTVDVSQTMADLARGGVTAMKSRRLRGTWWITTVQGSGLTPMFKLGRRRFTVGTTRRGLMIQRIVPARRHPESGQNQPG